jgi:hypothetical protein
MDDDDDVAVVGRHDVMFVINVLNHVKLVTHE